MAAWNRSRDVNGDREHSGGTSRPPLPRPDKGKNVHPVPMWEREFCCNDYNIAWETFCKNKCYIGLYKNVLYWDDSGALKNFEDAKERFRAKYYGKPFKNPVLDPDMYIDKVDHHCKVDPYLVAEVDKIAGQEFVADPGWGEPVPNLVPTDWGEPDPNVVPTGWGEPDPNVVPTGWIEPANVTPGAACGGQGNQTPEAVWRAQPCRTPNNTNNNFHGAGSSNNWHQHGVDAGHTSSGTGVNLNSSRMWISGTSGVGGRNYNVGSGVGVGSGNGSGRNGNVGGRGGRIWNGGGGSCGSNCTGAGRSNQRNQGEGQHQQRNSGSGGRMWNGGAASGSNWNGGGRGNQRSQGEGHHQRRNGGGMQRRYQDEEQHQLRAGRRQQQGQGARRMEWCPVQQHNRAPSPRDDPAA